MDGVSIDTLVAAAASGLVAAVITGLFALWSKRNEQLRERMLVAADDFATGVHQASAQLEQIASGTDAHPANIASMYEEYSRLVHEAEARVARVALLFGPSSDTAEAAEWVMTLLHAARTGAARRFGGSLLLYDEEQRRKRWHRRRKLPGTTWEEVERGRVDLEGVLRPLEDFQRDFAVEAWKDLRRPGRSRRWTRWRNDRRLHAAGKRVQKREGEPSDRSVD